MGSYLAPKWGPGRGFEKIQKICFKVSARKESWVKQWQEARGTPGRRPEKHRQLFKVGKTAQTRPSCPRHGGGYIYIYIYIYMGKPAVCTAVDVAWH